MFSKRECGWATEMHSGLKNKNSHSFASSFLPLYIDAKEFLIVIEVLNSYTAHY